ncbi:MAG: CVNH domain-containing protein [Janthinobacterium lividum]
MRPSRSELFRRSKGIVPLHALASALLVTSVSLASAAGVVPPRTESVLPVQYRQDGYGQDPYRQPPPSYDDPRNGQDRYGQGQRGYDNQGDRDRQDQRRPDDRGDRYGQGGGGRGGSYQQSCGEIRQNGSTLSAVCSDGRGRRVESSIDVNRCGRGDIGNSRGFLQCGNIRGNGRQVD